jgi:hypothetical protein
MIKLLESLLADEQIPKVSRPVAGSKLTSKYHCLQISLLKILSTTAPNPTAAVMLFP